MVRILSIDCGLVNMGAAVLTNGDKLIPDVLRIELIDHRPLDIIGSPSAKTIIPAVRKYVTDLYGELSDYSMGAVDILLIEQQYASKENTNHHAICIMHALMAIVGERYPSTMIELCAPAAKKSASGGKDRARTIANIGMKSYCTENVGLRQLARRRWMYLNNSNKQHPSDAITMAVDYLGGGGWVVSSA